MKILKKIAVYMMVATLSVGTVGLVANNTSVAGIEDDGDVITNPYWWLFTNAAGENLPSGGETTKKAGQSVGANGSSVAAPKKTKVKSATRKKLSAKKVKVSLKKITGAKGYYVQISKTRKFKKVLVKKYVKKAIFTIKNKKLKNKKKLYVRAKAYKLNGATKVCSKKWSKAKKVKIKK